MSESKQKVAMSTELHAEAKALLDAALQPHNLYREIRHDGGSVFSVPVYVGPYGASTFDDSLLTRFVLECHDRGWRGAVLPSAPRHLRFQISKRVRLAEAGDLPIMRGHPTLDEMIECRREHGGSWREYLRARSGDRVINGIRVRHLKRVPPTGPEPPSFTFDAFVDGAWRPYGPNVCGNWSVASHITADNVFPRHDVNGAMTPDTVPIGWWALDRETAPTEREGQR